jgi:hypothetical protein
MSTGAVGADVRVRYYVRTIPCLPGRTGTDCLDSGELTFSKRFGFLESGEDLNRMMYHTGNAMDYIGIVSTFEGAFLASLSDMHC